MDGKFLGKITSAEFGKFEDNDFLFGLILEFKFSEGNISSGGKYMINISEHCRWEKSERMEEIEKLVDFVNGTMNNAKCRCVSELSGKPVEILIKENTFKDFRILTEVL